MHILSILILIVIIIGYLVTNNKALNSFQKAVIFATLLIALQSPLVRLKGNACVRRTGIDPKAVKDFKVFQRKCM